MGALTDKKYLYNLEPGHEVVLRFAKTKYVNNGSLAIMAYIETKKGVWTFYDIVTVNLGDTRSDDIQYIHTNHWADGFDMWLVCNGMGVLTGNYKQSGFVEYPEFMFYPGFLETMSGEEIGSIFVEPGVDPDTAEELDGLGNVFDDDVVIIDSRMIEKARQAASKME